MEQSIQPIDVIALLGADGEIRPLRIRAQNGEQVYLQGTVKEILCSKENKRTGSGIHIFLCRIQAAGKCTVAELKYDNRNHSWYMVRWYE